VVCVAGRRWGGASGDAAAVVADDELVEHVVGHCSGLASVVEGGAVGCVDESVDAGVAGEASDGFG
jgi:hypothetical protein